MPRTETKFASLARKVERLIGGGAIGPGDRLPAERDLAGRFGTNRITLRKALSSLARRGALVHVDKKGWFVPGGTDAGAVANAVYVGQTSTHFYKELYLALVREAQRHNCRLQAFPTDGADGRDGETRLADVAPPTWHVIAAAHALHLLDELPAERTGTTVVVDIFDHLSTRACHHVYADRARAAAVATRHLVGCGHRKIAVVCGGSDAGVHDPADPVCQGYCAAMREAGLAQPAPLALPRSAPDRHVSILGRAIKGRSAPTALVCDLDYRAVAVDEAARKRGMKLPADLSVVGIGNTPWCEALRPALTSVSLEEDEMARLAVLLIREPAPDRMHAVYTSPRLVERDSVRPRA